MLRYTGLVPRKYLDIFGHEAFHYRAEHFEKHNYFLF